MATTKQDYYDALGQRHMIDSLEYFADALAQLPALRDDGLVELDARGLRATSRGRLLLRIIAMCFDRYLATTADAATPRYSRTV